MKNIKRIKAGKYKYRRTIIEKKKDGWHWHFIDIKCGYFKDTAFLTKREAETSIDKNYKHLRIGIYG